MTKRGVTNRILGHADESDGIEEYDNPLPDWWLGMFWLTIVFAIVYTVHYHFIADRSQPKALAAEMAEARARWPEQQGPVQVSTTEETVKKGREVYVTNCVPCHGKAMEGGIGPNLKDETWIHGNKAAEVVKTITTGVAAKGMPAWGPILGPERVSQVASFLASENPSIQR